MNKYEQLDECEKRDHLVDALSIVCAHWNFTDQSDQVELL